MIRSVLLALLLLLAQGCASPEASVVVRDEPSALEPTVASAPDPDLEEAACERCHVRQARAWSSSAHRTAFVDEVFQAEWAPSEQPACVRCHAPLADPERPEGSTAATGVSCVACHVREGSVLSARPAERAPHPITVEPSLATSAACAGCHDFTFARVAPTPYAEDGILQGTLHEWHEVEPRGECQQCHMRDSDGRVSHAFPGARDPALLSSALHVEAYARTHGARTDVTLVLTSEAGHAVPTGDMFRRLEVAAWVEGHERDRQSVRLMRRFEPSAGVRREVGDDRVPALGERRVELSLDRARRIAWRIEWHALDPVLAQARWLPEADVVRTVSEGVIVVEP